MAKGVEVSDKPSGHDGVTRTRRTSEATFSNRPLRSQSASAEMEDMETRDASAGDGRNSSSAKECFFLCAHSGVFCEKATKTYPNAPPCVPRPDFRSCPGLGAPTAGCETCQRLTDAEDQHGSAWSEHLRHWAQRCRRSETTPSRGGLPLAGALFS